MARATINMAHDARGVTISRQEAARLESERALSLLKIRKLSFLLDLDQTVIHATVDPTVGEWMRNPDNPNFPALTVILIDLGCLFFCFTGKSYRVLYQTKVG